MNLVLTYHRVVSNMRDVTGFFDTTAEEFSRQLRTAVKVWKAAPAAGFLFEGQADMSPDAPHLVLTFDDGTEDHYSWAAPLLEEQSLRGIFYVSTAVLDTPGYMTRDQCRDLGLRGHVIESHGHTHAPVHTIPRESLAGELARSRDELLMIGGCKIRSFAAVGGYIDNRLEEAALIAGFYSLRTLKWGYNKNNNFFWESINVNRTNGNVLFQALVEPKKILFKKFVYAVKEAAKASLLKNFYYRIRSTRYRSNS